jgi:septum formation protein
VPEPRISVPSLYLASASPRRRDLLAQIGLACRCLPVDLDESPLLDEAPAAYVTRLALDKARAARTLLDGEGLADAALILGADTAVVVADEVLGKPRDAADAAAMLRRLAGREHRVLTGVAVLGPDAVERLGLSESRVRMRPITEAEIAAYWATGEPADKAGAYGIQGRGALFIEAIAGSYSGVMGLPLFETAALLAAAGLPALTTELDLGIH